MQSKTSAFSGLLLALCLAFSSTLANAAGYTASNGKLYEPGGSELVVRGISHFGFNTPILQPQYLWEMGWKAQIDQIKALGFNAVRLPFVPDTLYNTTSVDKLSYVDAGKNPDLIGKTPLQAMDMWMAYADSVGLYVMLDFHSVSMVRQYPTWFVSDPADFNLIYNKSAYTKDNWIRDLTLVAKRYANLPHFFAIDIYNEPEGAIRWSTGDNNVTNPIYFWKAASEAAGTAVLQANPNLLIFVQGINGNFDGIENSNIPMNWGEDFQPLSYQPSAIPASKLVLTPHTYGPDVYVKSSFSAANYPANLAQDWETLFGKQYPAHPVVIGEWGGRYGSGPGGQKDVQWQNALVQYLLSKGIHSSFYWCYTPNSGDSGGILDDNLQVRQDKVNLLKTLWASSTPAPAPASNLAMASATATAPRTGGKVTLTVKRSGSGTGAISVKFQTADGTGTTGVDYTAQSGTLSWATGDMSSRSVNVAVAGTSSSTSKTFSVALSAPANGAVLSSPSSSVVTINATASGTTMPQQVINSFAPASGPVGTVLTVNGSGYTGSNRASVGGVDGALKVISDTQVQVTVPSGAASGKIALYNPNHTVSSSTAYTVTTTNPQQLINSFSPVSGPAGTVVTVTGSGFTGSNRAAIGGKDAVLKVLSDTQVQVTVPAAAPSGQVALFNPTRAAWSGGSFTVTSGTPQQQVQSFSPSSGAVGSVITLTGSGFLGSNQAWVGNAHNATLQVVSDTVAKVTVPAGATTGAVAILNSAHAAFTASSFTMNGN